MNGTIAPALVKRLVPLLVESAQRDRSLLIGYLDGQLLLARRPDHTDDLDTLLAKRARTIRGVQVVRGRLAFSPVSAPGELPAAEGDAGDWVVEPEDRSGDLRVRVGLPQGFERTLLTTDGAAVTKGQRAGSIAIYRHGTPYRLEFALEVRTDSPGDDDKRPPLRSKRAEKALAITPTAQAPEGRGRTATRRADAPPPPASAPAPARPERADRPVPVDAPAPEPEEEDTSWDDDEVKTLLALLEQQATAAPGKRSSSTLKDERQAAEEALGLLHALAKARGELSREEVCLLLGTDPGERFSRRAGAVTSAAKVLKDRGVVAASRADVLVSDYKDRRAGRNRVTHVHVRAEFVKPLRSRARRLAQAQQPTPARVGVKPRQHLELPQRCLASAHERR